MESGVESALAGVDALIGRFCAEGRDFDTVYVGGGTPTVLGPVLLSRLLGGIGARLGTRPAEWTVEANPESLDEACLGAIAASGATRLSIGIQSMDDGELELLGRPCGAEAVFRAVELARTTGLSLSADLMTALPGRRGRSGLPPGSLARTALSLADSGFSHLSVYDLVPEEGTRIASLLERGEFALPDEDEEAERRLLLERALGARGFLRYEISNYAMPGSESLHNGAYWAMRSYLGAGEGAVSTLRLRDSGGASLRITQSREPGGVADETRISPEESAFEMIMMGFRTSRGLDLADFSDRFGLDAESLIGKALSKWSDRIAPGRRAGGFLALDGRGMDLLNGFLVECLDGMEERFPGAGTRRLRRKNRTGR